MAARGQRRNAAYEAGEDLVQCALCTDDVKRSIWDNNIHIRTTHLMKSNIGSPTDPLIRYRNTAGFFTCECGKAFADSDALPVHVHSDCQYKGPRYPVEMPAQRTSGASQTPTTTLRAPQPVAPPSPPPPRQVSQRPVPQIAAAFSSHPRPGQAGLGLGSTPFSTTQQAPPMKRSGSAASASGAQGQRQPSGSPVIGFIRQHPSAFTPDQAAASLPQSKRSPGVGTARLDAAGKQRPTSVGSSHEAGPPRTRPPARSVSNGTASHETGPSVDRKPVLHVQSGFQPVQSGSAPPSRLASTPPPSPPQQQQQQQQHMHAPVPAPHQQFDLQDQLRLAQLLHQEQARHIEQLRLAESMQRRIELLRSYQQQHADQQHEQGLLLQAQLEAAQLAEQHAQQAAQIQAEQHAQRQAQQDADRRSQRQAEQLAQQEAQQRALREAERQQAQQLALAQQRAAKEQPQAQLRQEAQKLAESEAQQKAQREEAIRQKQLDLAERQREHEQQQQLLRQQQYQQQLEQRLEQQRQQAQQQWQQELQRRAGNAAQSLAHTQQAFFPDRIPTSSGQSGSQPSTVNAVAGPSRLVLAPQSTSRSTGPAPRLTAIAAQPAPSDRASKEFAEALQLHLVQLLHTGRKAVGNNASYGHLQVRAIPGGPLIGTKLANCDACRSIRSTSASMSPLEQDSVWRTHYGLHHWARCQLVLANDDGQLTSSLFPADRAPNGLWVCPVCASSVSTDARQLSVHLKSDCLPFRRAMVSESTAHALGAVSKMNGSSASPVSQDRPSAPASILPTLARPASTGPILQKPVALALLEAPTGSPTASEKPSSPAAGPRPADGAQPVAQRPESSSVPAQPTPTPVASAQDPNLSPAVPPLLTASALPPAGVPIDSLDAGTAVPTSTGPQQQQQQQQQHRTTADFAKYSAENYRFFAGLFLPLLQSETPVDRRHLFMVAPRIASVRDLHFRLNQAVDVLIKRAKSGTFGPAWSKEHSARLVWLQKASSREGPDAILGEKEDSFRLKLIVTLLLEYPLQLKETADYIQQWFPMLPADTKPPSSHQTAWNLFTLVSAFIQQYRDPRDDLRAALAAARITVARDGQRPYVLSPVKWEKVARSLLRWSEAVWHWWGVLDETLKTSALSDFAVEPPADGGVDSLLDAVETLANELSNPAVATTAREPMAAVPALPTQDAPEAKASPVIAAAAVSTTPSERAAAAADVEPSVAAPAAELPSVDASEAQQAPPRPATSNSASVDEPLQQMNAETSAVTKDASQMPSINPPQPASPRRPPAAIDVESAPSELPPLLSTSSTAASAQASRLESNRPKTKSPKPEERLSGVGWSPSSGLPESSPAAPKEPVTVVGWTPRAYAVPSNVPAEAQGPIVRASPLPVLPIIALPASSVTVSIEPSALETTSLAMERKAASPAASRPEPSPGLAGSSLPNNSQSSSIPPTGPARVESSDQPYQASPELSTAQTSTEERTQAGAGLATSGPSQSASSLPAAAETRGDVNEQSTAVASSALSTLVPASSRASLPTPPRSPPAPNPVETPEGGAVADAPAEVIAPPPSQPQASAASSPAPVLASAEPSTLALPSLAPVLAPAPAFKPKSASKATPGSTQGAPLLSRPPPQQQQPASSESHSASKKALTSASRVEPNPPAPSGSASNKATSSAPTAVPSPSTPSGSKPVGSLPGKKLAFKRTLPKAAAPTNSAAESSASKSAAPDVQAPHATGADGGNTAVCNDCKPPIAFSSLRRKEAHIRVTHMRELLLKDPAGWPHYIQRSADGRFHCRPGCPVDYKNRDPQKLRKHMRAQEHFPWSAGAAPAPAATASGSQPSAPKRQTAPGPRPAATVAPPEEPGCPPPKKPSSPWHKKRKQPGDRGPSSLAESASTRASPRVTSRATTPGKAASGSSSRKLGPRSSLLTASSPQPSAKKKARHSRVIESPPSEADSPPRPKPPPAPVKSKRPRAGSDSEEDQKWKPTIIPITIDDSDSEGSDMIVYSPL